MFVIELVKNEENIETMITQAIHLLIQVTNNYTMSYCYSQNDNLVFTVYMSIWRVYIMITDEYTWLSIGDEVDEQRNIIETYIY